ncbi:HigA family addiction module antitoxin [Parahaliea mediterranea]|uniref:HigA family addiction module antitoxin n=1 Tax=Parahaliea mediterranea TaxID=651086 RepID=UPI001300AE0C|nr:HigA family addiction module antitoxin [Parahaliea mediterranea]
MSKSASHPGALVDALVLQPGACSQSQLARMLGFNQPQPVNELVKGKRNITPKMALLLERVTDGALPAEFWLLAQMRWDVAQAREGLSPSRLNLVQPLDAADELGADDPAIVGLLQMAEEFRASR